MREDIYAAIYGATDEWDKERERLLDEAERLIFDMAAILDLHKLATSKVEAARAFLAKLEARNA